MSIEQIRILLIAIVLSVVVTLPATSAKARAHPHLPRIGVSNARVVRRCDYREEARRHACLAGASEQPGATPVAPSARGDIYWGAEIGTQLTGSQPPWDMSAEDTFDQEAGRSPSLMDFAQPFADCSVSPCSPYAFPTGAMQAVVDHGQIPFLSWASQSTPSSLSEPDYTLGKVIDGDYDPLIRSFADAARDFDHPFFLRFDWEMNGDWFPWSEGVNGNTSGQYVTAWRHVHDIFTQEGATDATWVWCPNVDPQGDLQDLRSLYPGDGYVDWTCLDGYNWGTNPARPLGWESFEDLYRSTYEEITGVIAPTKPMIIGEMGSSEYGGDKATWIRDALADVVSSYPDIRGLLWFDMYVDGMDWPIETSPQATSAFRAAIADPHFLGAEGDPNVLTPVAPPG